MPAQHDGQPQLLLGTAQLTRPYGFQPATPGHRADAVRLLHHANNLGVSRLDTAPTYGEAEGVIGQSGIQFSVDTKIAPRVPPAASLAASLKHLKREEVNLLYVHDPVCLREASGHTIRRARATVGEGARSLGISVYTRDEFQLSVQNQAFEAVQVPSSILDRRISESDRQNAVSQAKRLFVRSVFLQGALLAHPQDVDRRVPGLGRYVDVIRKAASELGRPTDELCLQWARSLSDVDGIIVGANSHAQLERTIAAWTAQSLSAQELEFLNRLPTPPTNLVDPREWRQV